VTLTPPNSNEGPASATLDPGNSNTRGGTAAITPATQFASPALNPATTAIASITTGAGNTKGAWTQLSAGVPFDVAGLALELLPITSADFLIDLGIGDAGSETVLVGNLLVSELGVAEGRRMVVVTLPVSIPEGTRLAARGQATAAAAAASVAVTLYDAGPPSASAIATYGAVTADSGGTQVDPGAVANTKGAWVELAAAVSSEIDSAVLLLGGRATVSANNLWWGIDIGVGASGSEVVKVPNLSARRTATYDLVEPAAIPIPLGVDAGARVAIRAQSDGTNATDRLFDAVLIGFTA
jgi:hypothetical protein